MRNLVGQAITLSASVLFDLPMLGVHPHPGIPSDERATENHLPDKERRAIKGASQRSNRRKA